jgi:hypothetical protein
MFRLKIGGCIDEYTYGIFAFGLVFKDGAEVETFDCSLLDILAIMGK